MYSARAGIVKRTIAPLPLSLTVSAFPR
jgi:hypothetical protein